MRMMPVVFVGHGSPENAIEDNDYSRAWRRLGETLPRPKGILCVSAHWVTDGTFATAMDAPRTIHDFWGFQKELYEKEYPAPGSRKLAERVKSLIKAARVGLDDGWGLDHGTWAVLSSMYPDADVPVVQLSLDGGAEAKMHYRMAAELKRLREEGVLVMGSGNIVHNLGLMDLGAGPYPWAAEFDEDVKRLILAEDDAAIADYTNLRNSRLAVPTNEHYLPLIYATALREKGEEPLFFSEKIELGSVSMRGIVYPGR